MSRGKEKRKERKGREGRDRKERKGGREGREGRKGGREEGIGREVQQRKRKVIDKKVFLATLQNVTFLIFFYIIFILHKVVLHNIFFT